MDIQVLLTPEGAIAGARVRTFLLEKRRVASPPPPSERNFHVFYMLAARQAGALRAASRLPAISSTPASMRKLHVHAHVHVHAHIHVENVSM